MGHPHRDQERQLAALRRAGGPLRDQPAGRPCSTRGGRIIQETRHFHEDTGDTTPGRCKETATDYRYFPEPDLVPLAPGRRPGWRELQAALPELPRGAPGAGCQRAWGLSDLDMQSMVNAGAVELIEATVAAGATAGRAPASGGWASCPGGPTRPASSWPTSAITPAQVAELQRWSTTGKLNDKLARQVLEGVLAGEGDADAVVMADARPAAVVSDTGALTAAVDEAIAANPDIAEKIRDGKVAAAGALVGAVMKTTRGQADAKTVRELILQKLS